MNDLHVMSLTGDALNRSISGYAEKCLLLLQRAFQKDTTVQQAFGAWIQDEFRETKSPDVLLHDPPLFTVGRFLSIPYHEIDQAIIKRAARVARDHHW
jgi:hypothetical protein